MKTISRIVLTVLILATLAGGWLYLYTHSHTISADLQNITLGRLKDLKQLDSSLNVNLLRSQTDINKSYDPLTQPLREFEDILKLLSDEAGILKDPELLKGVEEIRDAINAKMALIDRFKAQNALLKNSLRYIPTAQKDIQDQMRAKRDANALQTARLTQDAPRAFDQLDKLLASSNHTDTEASKRQINAAVTQLRSKMQNVRQSDTATRGVFTLVNLESNVNTLVGEVMRYNSVPEAEVEKIIKTGLDQMREASSSYPEVVHEQVDNLISHINVILRLRLQQGELLGDIARVPVVAKIDLLGNALTRRFGAELGQQFTYHS